MSIPGQNPNHQPHESLRVVPQEKDPLARPKHRILVKDGDGFFIVGQSEEPLEMLKLETQAKHAIVWQSKEVAIASEDGTMVQHFADYRPAEWQEPETQISESNKAVRDRWILNIVQWLLPRDLAEKIGDSEWQAAIQAQLKEMGVELSVSPTGCGVVIFRGGQSFAAWACAN